MSVYPKTRIHISLLLRTKNTVKLNRGLKKLASNHQNCKIIEHHNLLDQFGFVNSV